jgi:hypothetical protein
MRQEPTIRRDTAEMVLESSRLRNNIRMHALMETVRTYDTEITRLGTDIEAGLTGRNTTQHILGAITTPHEEVLANLSTVQTQRRVTAAQLAELQQSMGMAVDVPVEPTVKIPPRVDRKTENGGAIQAATAAQIATTSARMTQYTTPSYGSGGSGYDASPPAVCWAPLSTATHTSPAYSFTSTAPTAHSTHSAPGATRATDTWTPAATGGQGDAQSDVERRLRQLEARLESEATRLALREESLSLLAHELAVRKQELLRSPDDRLRWNPSGIENTPATGPDTHAGMTDASFPPAPPPSQRIILSAAPKKPTHGSPASGPRSTRLAPAPAPTQQAAQVNEEAMNPRAPYAWNVLSARDVSKSIQAVLSRNDANSRTASTAPTEIIDTPSTYMPSHRSPQQSREMYTAVARRAARSRSNSRKPPPSTERQDFPFRSGGAQLSFTPFPATAPSQYPGSGNDQGLLPVPSLSDVLKMSQRLKQTPLIQKPSDTPATLPDTHDGGDVRRVGGSGSAGVSFSSKQPVSGVTPSTAQRRAHSLPRYRRTGTDPQPPIDPTGRSSRLYFLDLPAYYSDSPIHSPTTTTAPSERAKMLADALYSSGRTTRSKSPIRDPPPARSNVPAPLSVFATLDAITGANQTGGRGLQAVNTSAQIQSQPAPPLQQPAHRPAGHHRGTGDKGGDVGTKHHRSARSPSPGAMSLALSSTAGTDATGLGTSFVYDFRHGSRHASPNGKAFNRPAASVRYIAASAKLQLQAAGAAGHHRNTTHASGLDTSLASEISAIEAIGVETSRTAQDSSFASVNTSFLTLPPPPIVEPNQAALDSSQRRRWLQSVQASMQAGRRPEPKSEAGIGACAPAAQVQVPMAATHTFAEHRKRPIRPRAPALPGDIGPHPTSSVNSAMPVATPPPGKGRR